MICICLSILVFSALKTTCGEKPFPTHRHILMHLQQATFENIVTKGEIAQNKQFLLLLHYFQLISENNPPFTEIFYVYDYMFSKASAADLLYVGKG